MLSNRLVKPYHGAGGYTFATPMFVRQAKLAHYALAGMTLVAVTLLAAGIGELTLKAGRPLSLDMLSPGGAADIVSQIQLPADLVSVLLGALRIGALLLLPFAIIHFIRSRTARRQVLLQLFYLLLFSAAILSLSRSFEPQQANTPVLPIPQGSLPQAAPGTDFVPPAAPPWLVTAVSVAGAAGALWLAYRLYLRTQPESQIADALAADAHQALADIESGHRLENVILRSYYQLCVASRRRRGISRASHQTPREYGSDLSSAGIPRQALAQLTALFEKARYGGDPLTQDDEREAVGALRTILRALGEL